MEKKRNLYVSVGEGVLRAFILTLAVLLIYAFILNFKDLEESTTSMVILVATLVSVMYGAIYASRKSGQKGWLNGMLVALLYMLLFYLVTVLGHGYAAITMGRVIKLILALIVGVLSGMLGINL
ncbi:MAG: TIGR04086 family membrane protein [Bacillota bacterium]|nr:TIGR04086 family membrane protein [Bacillota bacterium]